MGDAFLAMSSDRVRLETSDRAHRGTDVSRTPSRRSVRTHETSDSRESTAKRQRIEAEEETIVGIIVMMSRSIGTEIEEEIAGGPKENVTGTVRGADVTGGDVMIADRLIHKGCG